MKTFLTFAVLALMTVPAFATHGVSRFQARQIKQGQRAALNVAKKQQLRDHHNNAQNIVFVPVRVHDNRAQFNAGHCDNGALQLNNGHWHNGALQFNAGHSCSQFFVK